MALTGSRGGLRVRAEKEKSLFETACLMAEK